VGELTDRQRRRIVAAVEQRKAAEGISNAALGRIVNVSRTVIGRVLNGRYTGERDKYLRLLQAWLDGQVGRGDEAETPYVPTSVGERILTVCELAVSAPCIGLVRAASGLGKTAALREVARRSDLAPTGAAYIQAGEACGSKTELLRELADALDVRPARRWTGQTLYRRVRDRLAGAYSEGRGGPFLLLIDEATTLSPRAINLLRNLHDDPACRTAIVLADTIVRLDGFLHARGNLPGGTEQLSTRSRATFRADSAEQTDARGRPATTDVRAIAEAALRGLGHDRRLPAQTCRYLYQVAQRPGHYRNVVALLQNASYVAARQGWRCEYTMPQLDWVAPLSGLDSQLAPPEAPPFERDGRPAEARRAAG